MRRQSSVRNNSSVSAGRSGTSSLIRAHPRGVVVRSRDTAVESRSEDHPPCCAPVNAPLVPASARAHGAFRRAAKRHSPALGRWPEKLSDRCQWSLYSVGSLQSLTLEIAAAKDRKLCGNSVCPVRFVSKDRSCWQAGTKVCSMSRDNRSAVL